MRLKKSVKYSLITILTVGLVAHYSWYANDLNERKKEFEKIMSNHYSDEPGVIELFNLEEELIRVTDVYFTNYHLGDGSSGTTTASGLQIKDFEVNEDGMYTYEEKVVVATANMSRLTKGIAEGYKTHDLYEEFTIRLMNKEYPAIVLDVCGACYYMEGEFLQRYDIFVPKSILGKVIGQVVLDKENDTR